MGVKQKREGQQKDLDGFILVLYQISYLCLLREIHDQPTGMMAEGLGFLVGFGVSFGVLFCFWGFLGF